MNPLMRYALMRPGDNNEGQREDYGTESRFRDRAGREHYDNGRFAPMRSEYDGEQQMTYGQYSPSRSDYSAARMGYTSASPMPIDYDRPEMGGGDEREGRRSWKIIENSGPKYNGERNRDGMIQVYGFNGTSAHYDYPMATNEMEHHKSDKQHGRAGGSGSPHLTKEMAEEWMAMLQNADGSKGPHWTFEEVKNLMQTRGVQGDPMVVWVAMNAEYSDRAMLNRKYGVDRPEYYLDAAVTNWLNDKDAVPDKVAAYYTHVVKH